MTNPETPLWRDVAIVIAGAVLMVALVWASQTEVAQDFFDRIDAAAHRTGWSPSSFSDACLRVTGRRPPAAVEALS